MTTATTRNPKGAGRKPLDYDYATEYAEKVVSGEIIASKKNIQVAKRHLNDVKNGVEGYEWKPENANKVIKFIEMLPDPKSGELLKLELFQKFIVQSLYGFIDSEGNRRFTKAYISTARKNGKSLILASIGLYQLIFDKEPKKGREIYISSTSLTQSKIIFQMIVSQLNAASSKSLTLRKQFEVRKTDITHTPSESVLAPLSLNPSAADGKAVQTALMDEFASQKDDQMYNRMRTSQSLQRNPLMALISTASDDLNSPMYTEYKYITKLLKGEIKNENYFVYCAEQDSISEVENQDLWIKSNPLLSNKTHHKQILRNIKRDIDEKREQGNESGVLIKSFNMWQSTGATSFISSDS